ncbi:MAG: MFS transporter [Alcaligenaceae bacterium]
MSPPQPSPQSPPSAFASAGVLCLLIMLVHIAISGGRVAVTLTALELGRSTLEVGILIAVFALLPMLCSVKAGRLIDAIGPYKPMRVSAIMVVVGSLVPFAWQSLPSLMIAAVLVGSGHMTFQIAVQRQMGQSTGEDRLRNFSWLSLSMATSGLVGPLIAGISIDHLGHRSVFALLALSPILCLLGLTRVRRYLIASHIKAPPSEIKRSVSDLFASPALRKVFIANMLLSSAWDTHGFVVPIFGVSAGLSATTIGLILATFASATIVIRIALPFIQQYVRPWQLINIALIATALNFLLYPFFSQVWILMSMSFALGLALGSTQPGILALLQHHAPSGRAGEAFGLRMALINGCQVSLPLAFGALGAVMGGVMPLFWITSAALGAGRWYTRDAEIASRIATDTPPSKPPST